jgi:hypothetical protein
MTTKALWIFIILLMVLVFVSQIATKKEGFSMDMGANFNVFSKLSDFSTSYQYTTRITDDIYYNYMNGIFFLVPFTKAANEDPKITGRINAIKRNGTTLSYTVDNVTKEVSDVLKSVTLEKLSDPTTVQINSFDKKEQVVAISYGLHTYIMLMTGMSSQGYTISRLMIYDNQKADSDTTTSWSISGLQSTWTDPDAADTDKASNEKEIKEELYDNSNKLVYRIKKNILYDKINGNLLIVKPAIAANASATPPTAASPKTVQVYKRNFGQSGVIGASDTPSYSYTTAAPISGHTEASGITGLKDTASIAIVVREPDTKRTVIYWSRNLDTVIFVLNDVYDATTGSVDVAHALAVYSPSGNTKNTDTSSGSTEEGKSDDKKDDKKHDDKDDKALEDEYMKWSNYMLKTQVVPPVCPSCPSCPANQSGVCTSCGGQGGSGSQSTAGSSLAFSNTGASQQGTTQSGASQQQGTSSGGGVTGPSSAIASVGQSAGSAVSNVAGTVGNVAGTVGGVANTAIGTAGNIVSGTVGTASNLVSGTIGTAADLLYSAGSGLGNMLSGSNDGLTRVGYQQSYARAGTGYNRNNTGYPPATSQYDAYSYNGALQSKGANYRPVTADFSAFRR